MVIELVIASECVMESRSVLLWVLDGVPKDNVAVTLSVTVTSSVLVTDPDTLGVMAKVFVKVTSNERELEGDIVTASVSVVD